MIYIQGVMSRSPESFADKLTRPFMGFFGIKSAELTSEQARNDHRKLLNKAERLVRLASEEIEDVELLDRLAARGVQVELVVGPTQDRLNLAGLEARGVSISQLDATINQPITVVDGSHTRVTERKIPGRARQCQYVVYGGSPSHIYNYNQLFESLSAKARKP